MRNQGLGPSGQVFQRLALATVAAILVLVVLGGVVRVTESGLGCPDWPLCHGKIIPPADTQTLIEYSHRLVASVVGILVLATAVTAWLRYRGRPWILAPSSLSLILVVVQGALGGVTVLTELEGSIVTAHLALAEALLVVATLVFLASWRGVSFSQVRVGFLPLLAAGTALAAYGLLLSGSYTTTSGASGACNDWPLCQGEVFISSRLPAIHMAHRYVTLFVGLLILATVVAAWRQRGQRRDLAWVGLAAGGLFLVQAFVGAMAVWWGLPAEMRALHLALASTVWIALAALAMLPYTPVRTASRGTDPEAEPLPTLRPVTQ